MDDRLTGAVIGAAIEVHTALGPGFLESVYQGALRLEMEARGIPFVAQARIEVNYRGAPVGTHVLDYVVDDRLVVELKAAEDLSHAHRAQLVSYLRATGARTGLLLNFGQTRLQIRRLAHP